MAIPALVWAMLPSVISAGAQYLGRPKKKEYVPDTSYIDKYIAHLKSRRADKEVERMAMYPALRAIGKQYGRTRRDIEFEAAKYGYRGSGIEAQAKLSASQQYMGAAQEVGERAGFLQRRESRRIEDYIQQLMMQKGAVEERGTREFARAERESRIGIGATLAGGVVSGAQAVSQQALAKRAAGQAAIYQDIYREVSLGEKDYNVPELTEMGLTPDQIREISDISIGKTLEERKVISKKVDEIERKFGSEIPKANEYFGSDVIEGIRTGDFDPDLVRNWFEAERERLKPPPEIPIGTIREFKVGKDKLITKKYVGEGKWEDMAKAERWQEKVPTKIRGSFQKFDDKIMLIDPTTGDTIKKWDIPKEDVSIFKDIRKGDIDEAFTYYQISQLPEFQEVLAKAEKKGLSRVDIDKKLNKILVKYDQNIINYKAFQKRMEHVTPDLYKWFEELRETEKANNPLELSG